MTRVSQQSEAEAEALNRQGFFAALPFNSDHQMKRRIRACSIDADDCFLPNLIQLQKYLSVFEYNQAFVEQLFKDAKARKFHEVIFLVGSSRQHLGIDTNAMLQITSDGKKYKSFSESFFHAIAEFVEKIQKYLNDDIKDISIPIKLDKFLLLDVLHGKEFGSTFSEALSKEELQTFHQKNERHTGSDQEKIKKIFDEHKKTLPKLFNEYMQHLQNIFSADSSKQDMQDTSKFSLLYAQIHKIASENSDAEIDFHFYDDNPIIMNQLYYLFFSEPSLIPKNVTLNLHCYQHGKHIRDNETEKDYDTANDMVLKITGNGEIDRCYCASIKEIAIELLETKTKTEKEDCCLVGDVAKMYFNFQCESDGFVLGGMPDEKLFKFLENRNSRLRAQKVEHSLYGSLILDR